MTKSKSSKNGTHVSRRSFLKTSSAAIVAGAFFSPLHVEALPASTSENFSGNGLPSAGQRLGTAWEYHQGKIEGSWEVWRTVVDDTVNWQPVSIPHCFNARDGVDPDGGYYQGAGWYRTRLKLENPYPNGRTQLHFEGAGQRSEVYVFTQKVGEHVGGYDEFKVDITDAAARAARDEKNKGLIPVTIMCDNSREAQAIPSNMSDFNIYGGLYRHVNLVYVPAVSLERVQIDTDITEKTKARVSIKALLYNPSAQSADLEIAIEVLDSDGKRVHASNPKIGPWNDVRELAVFELQNPKLWSPAKPSLYQCTVTLKSSSGEHRITERFGVRFFEFIKQGPFKLNGERFLIRGTQRHEDHAGVGAALTDEMMRREMTLIKEMGANFVRLGHYQNSRVALDLCDELGLLAWEEIPWCRGGIGGDVYKDLARRMLRNMIDQHRNHPSIIIWGMGNENDWPGDFEDFDKEKIRAFMKELNDTSHSLDPSRKTAIRRCEFCSDIIDVYSPSIWAGWYSGRYTSYKTLSETEMKKVNHFLHMEWGGDSHAGRYAEIEDQILAKIDLNQTDTTHPPEYFLTGGVERASKDGDWSENYICNLFDWHLKEQETMDWLSGSAQWVFKDFATPLRPENPVPRVNQKGVVERDLTPKEGYYVFQSYWTEKPMVRLFGHSLKARWGASDEPKLVKVYSNCSDVELIVNGVSAGTKKRQSQNFPAAGLRWMVKFKEGENQIKAVARKSGETVTDEIRFRYQTSAWAAPARIKLEEIARQGNVFTVEARVFDAKDIACLDSHSVVRFGLAGDGRLIDNLGTSSGSRKVEMYNGRAIIRIDLAKGQAVISVKSADLGTAFLELKAA